MSVSAENRNIATPAGDEPGPVGRRERKKAATRSNLEEASFRLFASQGYDETTLQDITEAADVAPRTFFRYFASKEELILGSAAEMEESMTSLLGARPQSEPMLDGILAALECLDPEGASTSDPVQRERLLLRFRIMGESPAVRAGLLDSYGVMERAIAAFVAQRTGADAVLDLEPPMIAASIVAAVRVSVTCWAARGGGDDLAELFAVAVGFALDGLKPA